jgi:DNA-binding HxlR family transcriptional regulator
MMVLQHAEAASPIDATMSMLRKRWKPIVLWELASGPRRYQQIQGNIPGIAHKVLIEALRDLEADGLVSRHEITGGPRHVEYALTELGRSLCPILELMDSWGRAALSRQSVSDNVMTS